MLPLPQLATMQSVADALGVSPDTVRRLIAAGDLAGVRIGSRMQVEVASVIAYVERQRWQSASDSAARVVTATSPTTPGGGLARRWPGVPRARRATAVWHARPATVARLGHPRPAPRPAYGVDAPVRYGGLRRDHPAFAGRA